MSLNKTLRLVTFILALFTNCSNNEDATDNDFIIYQEGNTKITLLDVMDSRCPINANCVWEGNAEVSMRIEKDNETMDFSLNTAGNINNDLNYPTSTTIFDLFIELLDVQPYPEIDVTYTLEDYVISLNVTN